MSSDTDQRDAETVDLRPHGDTPPAPAETIETSAKVIPFRAASKTPETIGHYRIVRAICEGGMSAVHLVLEQPRL